MHIYFCVGTLLFDSLRQGAVKCQATQDIDKRHPAAHAAKEGIHRTSICRINFYKIIHVYIGLSGGRFEITYDILNSMVILCGIIKHTAECELRTLNQINII